MDNDLDLIELLDDLPEGTHKVIIDSFEKAEYEDYTYLNFLLVGLEGDSFDKQIIHGVPLPRNDRTTGRSKLGQLIKAAIKKPKGSFDIENHLLQKEIMVEVVEEGFYLKVDRVWPVGEEDSAKNPKHEKHSFGKQDSIVKENSLPRI